MKKVRVMVVVVAAFLVSINANAIVDEGWERPIFRSNMVKLDAWNGFENAEDIHLLMTKLDESERPTGLQLSYSEAPSDVAAVVDLKITEVRDVGCGSVQYVANLPESPENLKFNSRFTVVLTDHTKRVCRDRQPYLWKASVRQGYGWCGTFDATMDIAGNPEPVYTIMDR
ncbi:MAG: hypothetical protein AAB309_00235 [Deltaproteobacteria bacterium]